MTECTAVLNLSGTHVGCDLSHPHLPLAHSSREHRALWMGADEVAMLDSGDDPEDREIR